MSSKKLANILSLVWSRLKWLGSKAKAVFRLIKDKWDKLSDDVKVFVICAVILTIIVDIAIAVKLPPDEEQKFLINYSEPVAGVGNEITITLAGDIMCHDGQLLDGRQEDGSYSFSSCFRDIALLIKKADIAFANYEGTIAADNESVYGYPYFFTPYEFGAEIVDSGFNVLSVNNTQCFNGRESGLTNTIDCLTALGADVFGASLTDNEPLIVEADGIKVGFVSAIDKSYLNDSDNGNIAKDYINVYDREHIRSDVESCISRGSDVVIAYIRWGTEGNNVPNDYMKAAAEYLVSIGVDIVVGGGSHTVMPMDIIDTDDAYNIGNVRKGYVFYSLGNFVSNQRTNSGDMGAIAEIKVRKMAENSTRIISCSTTPIYTNVDISDGRNFKVLPVYEDSVPPSWMDETNKDRFIKVYSVVDTVLNSFKSAGWPHS